MDNLFSSGPGKQRPSESEEVLKPDRFKYSPTQKNILLREYFCWGPRENRPRLKCSPVAPRLLALVLPHSHSVAHFGLGTASSCKSTDLHIFRHSILPKTHHKWCVFCVDLGRIELPPQQCECRVMPLYYRPGKSRKMIA